MLMDKDFKRVLKELGLYNKWKVARRNYEITCPESKEHFYKIKSGSLTHFIDSSFVWSGTDNVDLWVEFSNAASSSVTWKYPKEFCCEEGIEYLKRKLKYYLKWK